MKKLLLSLASLINAGKDAVLVTIVESSGSVPRGQGARMLVADSGLVCGTIGGGALEHMALSEAADVLRVKNSRSQRLDLSNSGAATLGMVCGGSVGLYYLYINGGGADAIALAGRLPELLQSREPAWLIVRIADGTRGSIIFYDACNGFSRSDVAPNGLVPILSGRRALIELGGDRYFAERLSNAGTVYIFGAGHVARELVPLLSRVDFSCAVLDDRAEFARPELFPEAYRVLLTDFSDIGRDIELTGDDYVVVMTRGHGHDADVEAHALRSEARYIGVMGSASKRVTVSRKMLEQGFSPEDLERVKTPIGLEIKSDTPAEIAVSIAAELILKRAESG